MPAGKPWSIVTHLSQGRRRIEFVCRAAGASEVQLILKGDEMAQERIIPMTSGEDHRWFAILRLSPGVHEFAYQTRYEDRLVVHEMGPVEQIGRRAELEPGRRRVCIPSARPAP